jgi:endoglucanase
MRTTTRLLPLLAGAAVAAALALPSPAAAAGSEVFPGGPAVPVGTSAERAAQQLRAEGRTIEADAAARIAAQPSAVWIGDWLQGDALVAELRRQSDAAAAQGRTAVFVTYAIPGRDCGNHSAGGLPPERYRAWNRTVADTLRGTGAAVIVEPDALALQGTCPGLEGDRSGLLYDASRTLSGAGLTVYLDAGHSGWVPAETMIQRLRAAGLEFARGFSTNVSNHRSTEAEVAYAERLRATSGKHAVIDVSRNGAGWTGDWCNDPGARLGEAPRVVDDRTGVDALLWIKRPGESDGWCNGGPGAGQWWAEGAAALAR